MKELIKIFKMQLLASGHTGFAKLLTEDNTETNYNLIMFLDSRGLITVTQSVRLVLFKVLFNSGAFCYVPLDSEDFRAHFDYIEWDLRTIANIIDNESLKAIDSEMQTILNELYLFEEPMTLKDMLL